MFKKIPYFQILITLVLIFLTLQMWRLPFINFYTVIFQISVTIISLIIIVIVIMNTIDNLKK
jgi:ABC-type transport system involved in cytochrome c biogenesis permease subunit